MSQLLEMLLKRGFNAKIHNQKIFVSFAWFTGPVSITRDEVSSRYRVKQHYLGHALLSVGMLFSLSSAIMSQDMLFIWIFTGFLFFFPVSIWLTFRRTKELIRYIDTLNQQAELSE